MHPVVRTVFFLIVFVGLAVQARADYENDPWEYPITNTQRLKVALPLYGGVVAGQSLAGDASHTGGVYGFGLDFWFGRRTWSLGFDILSISKGFGLASSTTRIDYLQMPLILRRTLWNSLSLGVGGYAAPVVLAASQKSGSVATDSSDFVGDYGLVFSVRYARRIRPKLRLGVEARYNMGLANVSSTATHKLRSFLVLATLEFGLW